MSAYGTFREGGKPGRRTAVTPKSLSTQAGVKHIRGASGAFTQNTTVKTSLGPLGFRGILTGGYISFTTLPVGGTLTVRIVAYDASGNAEINLTETLDPETGTVREGKAFTLAGTNVELEADDTIEIHTIASDDTVSQAAVGGSVSLTFFPSEDSTVDNDIEIGADLVA